MLEGYAELERLERRRVNLLVPGESRRLLELNRLVLYGARTPSGNVTDRALSTGEQHFYESRAGGVGDLIDWAERHRGLPPPRLAAGLYVRLQSAPQLFVEGNHRTGALLVAHVMLHHGHPPFVLTPALAPDWFALTPELQRLHRHGLPMLVRAPALRRRLAALIVRQCDPRHVHVAGHDPTTAAVRRAARRDGTDERGTGTSVGAAGGSSAESRPAVADGTPR